MASLGGRLKYTLRGRRSRACKLDETTVAAIKRDLFNGMTHKTAAQKYHVARGTVGNISTGLTWGWVVRLIHDDDCVMTQP